MVAAGVTSNNASARRKICNKGKSRKKLQGSGIDGSGFVKCKTTALRGFFHIPLLRGARGVFLPP